MCDAIEDYLQEMQRQDRHIEKRWEDLQRLRSLREKVTTSYSMTPASGSDNNDKMCATTNKILALEKELDEKIDRFIELKMEIKSLFEKLHDIRMFDVLDKMYFEYKSFDVVAHEMGLSEKTIRNIHEDAMQAVEALMEGGEEHEG